MFRYNRFWHFWSTLDNRQYLRAVMAAIFASLVVGFVFFPVLAPTFMGGMAMVIIPALMVGSVVSVLNTLSDFFYRKQCQTLQSLKKDTPANKDERLLNEQLDLYLTRRVVCPTELLTGILPPTQENSYKLIGKSPIVQPPLLLEKNTTLSVKANESSLNRNPSFIATSPDQNRTLFVKRTATMDALSEVAAREMAEIVGFGGLIPQNTLSKNVDLHINEQSQSLLLSEAAMKTAIDDKRKAFVQEPSNLTPGALKVVSKFISHMQAVHYKLQAQKDKLPTLLYTQEHVRTATDGQKWFTALATNDEQNQNSARELLNSIDQASFQDNFLLQIVLGAQDANPGNTLFVDAINSENQAVKKMHSIDNERIMPEDNYNITKFIPVINGSDMSTLTERPIENVFPMRLWLAGLPQADVPFSKDTIIKRLGTLDPSRLLAYHRHKKLFTPAAVGAQQERVEQIRSLFKAELKKPVITLTPKTLFLTFVNNHPSYGFLKDQLKTSDFITFIGLGQIPADAEVSLCRHPRQYFPIYLKLIEMLSNELKGNLHQFSDDSFTSPYAPKAIFFILALANKQSETAMKTGLDILEETSQRLKMR